MGRPATTPASRATTRADADVPAGMVASAVTSPRPISSASARRTSSTTKIGPKADQELIRSDMGHLPCCPGRPHLSGWRYGSGYGCGTQQCVAPIKRWVTVGKLISVVAATALAPGQRTGGDSLGCEE